MGSHCDSLKRILHHSLFDSVAGCYDNIEEKFIDDISVCKVCSMNGNKYLCQHIVTVAWESYACMQKISTSSERCNNVGNGVVEERKQPGTGLAYDILFSHTSERLWWSQNQYSQFSLLLFNNSTTHIILQLDGVWKFIFLLAFLTIYSMSNFILFFWQW